MKETIEALKGLIALGKEVAALSKDGVQVTDAVALAAKIAQDDAFRTKIINAVQGVEKIPAEVMPVTIDKVITIVVALSAEFK